MVKALTGIAIGGLVTGLALAGAIAIYARQFAKSGRVF